MRVSDSGCSPCGVAEQSDGLKVEPVDEITQEFRVSSTTGWLRVRAGVSMIREIQRNHAILRTQSMGQVFEVPRAMPDGVEADENGAASPRICVSDGDAIKGDIFSRFLRAHSGAIACVTSFVSCADESHCK